MGHLERCLAIASKLVFHEALFLINEKYQLGVDKVDKLNYSFKTYDDLSELLGILREFDPHIIVNDILDTSVEYVHALKNEGYFVVNFEDLGMGSDIADVVFDDFYEHNPSKPNVFSGYKYFILNDEYYYQPSKIITNDVNNVLVTFGESDRDNLTEKVIDAILTTDYDGRIDVVVGLAYDSLDELIAKYESNPLIQIYRDVSNFSEFVFKADIVFTGVNKKLYEICSIGVPTLCLCQDERETTRLFANSKNGIINLGLGSEVGRQEIIDKFLDLVNSYDLRLEINSRMSAIDLKNGFDNIDAVIEEEYKKFLFKQNLS